MARIHIDHISRVEGHGALTVELDGNTVRDVKLNLFEGMRGFERVVLGRPFTEIPAIICRICAICSAGHAITAHMAVEKALGIPVPAQTELLRELAFLGMFIESHSLHVFALALPDYLGYAGIADMAQDHKEVVTKALQIKKTGNAVQELIGGRAIHHVNTTFGGFGKLPSQSEVRELRAQLANCLTDMDGIVELLAGLSTPDYAGEEILFMAIRPAGDGYGFFGDTIVFSDRREAPVDQYKTAFQETESQYSNAKRSTVDGLPFMVGALARINLFGDRLTGKAAEALAKLQIPVPSKNALYNNLAQVVELVYALERAIEICDQILAEGLKAEPLPEVIVRSGQGTVATELPRGTLYHSFSFDDNGLVTAADVITPTALNQASVEQEITNLGTSYAGQTEDELQFLFERLVRAYDPCISCSVHIVQVKAEGRHTID